MARPSAKTHPCYKRAGIDTDMHQLFKLIDNNDQQQEEQKVRATSNRKQRQCEKTAGCTYTYTITSNYTKHNCESWAKKNQWSTVAIPVINQDDNAVMEEELDEIPHQINTVSPLQIVQVNQAGDAVILNQLMEFILTDVFEGLRFEVSFERLAQMIYSDDQGICEQFQPHFKSEKQLFIAVEAIADMLKAYKILEIKADPLSVNQKILVFKKQSLKQDQILQLLTHLVLVGELEDSLIKSAMEKLINQNYSLVKEKRKMEKEIQYLKTNQSAATITTLKKCNLDLKSAVNEAQDHLKEYERRIDERDREIAQLKYDSLIASVNVVSSTTTTINAATNTEIVDVAIQSIEPPVAAGELSQIVMMREEEEENEKEIDAGNVDVPLSLASQDALFTIKEKIRMCFGKADLSDFSIKLQPNQLARAAEKAANVKAFKYKCLKCKQAKQFSQFRYEKDLTAYWQDTNFRQLSFIDCGIAATATCLRIIGKWDIGLSYLYDRFTQSDTTTYILDIADFFADSLNITSFQVRSLGFNLKVVTSGRPECKYYDIFKRHSSNRTHLVRLLNKLEMVPSTLQFNNSGSLSQQSIIKETETSIEDMVAFLSGPIGSIILTLVDFAFIPGGNPARSMYLGHYIIVVKIHNSLVHFIDPQDEFIQHARVADFNNARKALNVNQSCMFISYELNCCDPSSVPPSSSSSITGRVAKAKAITK